MTDKPIINKEVKERLQDLELRLTPLERDRMDSFRVAKLEIENDDLQDRILHLESQAELHWSIIKMLNELMTILAFDLNKRRKLDA